MNFIRQRFTLIISLLVLFCTMVFVTSIVLVKYLPPVPTKPTPHVAEEEDNHPYEGGDDIVDQGTELAGRQVASANYEHHSGSGVSPTFFIIGLLIFGLMFSVGVNFATTRYFIKTIEKILSNNISSNVLIQKSTTPMIEKTAKDISENEIRQRSEDEQKSDVNNDEKK